MIEGVFMAFPALAGFAAHAIFRACTERAGSPPTRINVRGIEVPVVLGDALVGGSLIGTGVVALLMSRAGRVRGETVAVLIALIVMWAAGTWDDRRGDERPRGFRGHLGALRSRAVTGGLVKIGAGAVTGIVVAAFLPVRGADPMPHVIETVALVALSANLINLFDRAPGRAGKVSLLLGVSILLFGHLPWMVSATPVLGALVVCLVHDLRERGMLGDAGANPLGAVLGVGLAASLDEPARLFSIAVLLALNLASERWSFSRAIEASPPLRWFDGLGRQDQVASK